MNNILRYVLLVGQTLGQGKVALRASFEWNWDHGNHCGERPPGPMYPYPVGPGNFSDPGNCDIVPELKYFYNYECETPCQMDKEKKVKLMCSCLEIVGPIQKVHPCKWVYEDEEKCPEVPLDQQIYDWECDPRVEGSSCPPDQYPGGPVTTGANPYGMYSWSTQMNGNMTEMMQGGMMPGMGMPGYINHIYIQPVMQQSIGDVENADGDNSFAASSTHAHLTVEDELAYAAQLAEAKEQTRSYKSAVKAAEDSMKRERLRYEEQLAEKESSRQELLVQLHVMQDLVKYRVENGENPDFSDVEKQNPRILNLDLMQMDVSAPIAAPEVDETNLSKYEIRKAAQKELKRSKKKERRQDRRAVRKEAKEAAELEETVPEVIPEVVEPEVEPDELVETTVSPKTSEITEPPVTESVYTTVEK